MGVRVITLRRFEQSDVSVAVDLERAHQPKPWTEKIFGDELAADDRVYLVADHDGAVVGFGGVMVVGEEAHLTNLLVDDGHRGQGIGGRLLTGLIEAAVGEGARHLTLEVRSQNEAARSLYAKYGLAPVGVRKGYYGDDDALVMWAHDIDQPRYLESIR